MYKILELFENTDVTHHHPSFGTFDVKVELIDTGLVKWVSIPHELFFEYIKNCNPTLYQYVDSNNFVTWEDTIDDLYELGYEFEPDLLKYLEVNYSKFIFESMTECYYDPNSNNDDCA